MLAWHVGRRAQLLNIPKSYAVDVQKLLIEAETHLIGDHTFIRLRVEPPEAKVSRQGAAWKSPREIWTKRDKSTVALSAEGYETKVLQWEHALGIKHEKLVSLTKLKSDIKPAKLVIKGSPKGAQVHINGKPTCILPACVVTLKPGRFRIRVASTGHVEHQSVVSLRAGEVTNHNVTLAATVKQSPVPTVTKAPPKPKFGTAKWAVLGSGIALVAAGGGLFGYAANVVDDAETLHASDLRKYSDQQDELQSKLNGAQISAWVLTGLGVASLCTSVALFTLDKAPATTAVAPMLVPGGAGLSASVAF